MSVPTLLPTAARDEAFAGVTYHIEGELVPVLSLELSGQTQVFFEHHILLWKEPRVEIGVKSLKGGFKRVMAGMPVFLTETQGVGRIAFSRDGAGHVVALHLHRGEAIDVREHQFLAATSNIEYTYQRVKGIANMLFSGTGFFIDTFGCPTPEGIVWLLGYGNVFELTLKPNEQIDIEPGGWIYKDRTVTMETKMQRLSTGLLASAGQVVWNRFTGPGRIGLQSMYVHFGSEE